ncbi:hypothetical protein SLEP1_g16118 [Rubroshorea leprosula]|uniref:Transmembrane protein n=1 Tax=Rubroshorea leprosula TaxID=152421 RepID=A0AAV5J0E3_9ROSI|nr:hypothetical protein SLEP1_g16118 [Rubroshorea leprosula]
MLVGFPRSGGHHTSHDAEGGWSPPVWVSRLGVLEAWRNFFMSRLKGVSFAGSFDHRNLYSLFLVVVRVYCSPPFILCKMGLLYLFSPDVFLCLLFSLICSLRFCCRCRMAVM